MERIKKLLLYALVNLVGEYKRAKIYKWLLGVQFGEHVRISGIPYFGSEPFLIRIGNNVTITKGVTFHNHDGGVSVLRNKHPKIDLFRPIVVGNNVFIGSNSTLMPGVILGNNIVVAASSVVTHSFPDNVVIGGVPARIIKTIDEYAQKVLPETIVLENRTNGKARKEEILRRIKII